MSLRVEITMMLPLSVIIPAHNEENYIRNTLHSLKQQTFQNFETIIVTNGCTDKTEEIVKKRTNEKVKHFNINMANVARNRSNVASLGELGLEELLRTLVGTPRRSGLD